LFHCRRLGCFFAFFWIASAGGGSVTGWLLCGFGFGCRIAAGLVQTAAGVRVGGDVLLQIRRFICVLAGFGGRVISSGLDGKNGARRKLAAN
jgi:hypothetical protein